MPDPRATSSSWVRTGKGRPPTAAGHRQAWRLAADRMSHPPPFLWRGVPARLVRGQFLSVPPKSLPTGLLTLHQLGGGCWPLGTGPAGGLKVRWGWAQQRAGDSHGSCDLGGESGRMRVVRGLERERLEAGVTIWAPVVPPASLTVA